MDVATRRVSLTMLLAAALLAGCAGRPARPAQPAADAAPWIAPMQAVQLAAAASGRDVSGVFALTVQATGEDRGRLFLNSERDYRDPRNLSIAVDPQAEAGLAQRFGTPLQATLRGKRLLVSGAARRVRIDFTVDGKPSGKYYYQTHVRVTDPDQIRAL